MNTPVLETERLILRKFTEYDTSCFITSLKPCSYMEIEMENSSIKGHWTAGFKTVGQETELVLTMYAETKHLSTRPVGKSVFEQTYLRKELEEFPAYLINAIRSSDEDIASNNKVKACMVFGALVFILLAMVNS